MMMHRCMTVECGARVIVVIVIVGVTVTVLWGCDTVALESSDEVILSSSSS